MKPYFEGIAGGSLRLRLELEREDADALGFAAPQGMRQIVLSLDINVALAGPLRDLYARALTAKGGQATLHDGAVRVRRGGRGAR